MFQKIPRTAYPPKKRPLMIWDGSCGFCRYWVIRWHKITVNKIDYVPFQEVATDFPDIDIDHFREASRLIEPDGTVYSGPRSAYRTFTYGGSWSFLDRWYANNKLFRSLSDALYNWMANNRSFFYKLTRLFFGSDPENVRPFWVIYLAVLLYLLYQWL